MKHMSKWLMGFVVALLLFGIVFMAYLWRARTVGNEYQFQVDAILAAARVANENQTVTEEDKAVIAEYEGKRAVIAPGNYTALSAYLRKDAAMPPFSRIETKNALKITFCGQAVLYAQPVNAGGDRALVHLTSRGTTYRMHIRGGNVWQDLLRCCTQGTYHDNNIPLD